jgi:type IV secretory pathway component VirB8
MSISLTTGKVQMLYAALIQKATISQSTIEYGASAQYTITITTYNPIPSTGSIVVQWPS